MSADVDVEGNPGQTRQKPCGFAALSSFIASDKDHELLIFRKFDEISARNILYLQCELLSIEDKLRRWDREVSSSDNEDLKKAARTWEVLVEQAENEGTEAQSKMALVFQLRTKMKEYHEALDLQSRIAQLHRPEQRAIRVAQNELWGGPLLDGYNKQHPLVSGSAGNYLDAEHEGDLVALKAPVETDSFSRFLRAHWPRWLCKEEISRDGCSLIQRFDERSVTIAVAISNVIAAIILLVAPITSLSFVESRSAILGTICSFTALFALSVGLMTNAKRAEIFAGGAAYAAVLVVFVSNSELSGAGQPAQ